MCLKSSHFHFHSDYTITFTFVESTLTLILMPPFASSSLSSILSILENVSLDSFHSHFHSRFNDRILLSILDSNARLPSAEHLLYKSAPLLKKREITVCWRDVCYGVSEWGADKTLHHPTPKQPVSSFRDLPPHWSRQLTWSLVGREVFYSSQQTMHINKSAEADRYLA